MSVLAAYIVPHPPIIIPAVGRGEEKKIEKTINAYREIAREIAKLAPETLILTSPHTVCYADYFHIAPGASAKGDLAQFMAPNEKISVRYDKELAEMIVDRAAELFFPAGYLGEKSPDLDHACMVPLSFILKEWPNCRIVRIGLSGLSPLVHYKFGTIIRHAIEQSGRKVVAVASGDLSHRLKKDGPYGLSPSGAVFDKKVTEIMRSGDFGDFLEIPEELADDAGECGLRSFQIMSGILDGLAIKPRLLSYEGPFGVGYAVASFQVTGKDPERQFGEKLKQKLIREGERKRSKESEIVKLARETLELYVKEGKIMDRPKDLSAEWTEKKAGAFVSIKKEGRLRGCIGTIFPTAASIADEVIGNAIQAGTADPRFPAITPGELPYLVFSVDVLKAPEPIDSPKQLDPQRYGVIVSCGSKRGLLLPRLEGVDTVEKQIDIARRKGGIGKDEPYRLERFEGIRYH